jgi:hypothetical protein
MLANRTIRIILGITGLIVIPVQMVTTFILGLFVSLTFGLLLIPISIVWTALFLGPLLGLSYVYERIVILRPFISIIGIPLAVIGHTYVALMPSMGEMDSRFDKLILCQTFPYTWKYIQFQINKLNIGKDDVLTKILRRVSRAKPFDKYLDTLRADVYSRPDYMNGKHKLDW